jgi:hypothetical protein
VSQSLGVLEPALAPGTAQERPDGSVLMASGWRDQPVRPASVLVVRAQRPALGARRLGSVEYARSSHPYDHATVRWAARPAPVDLAELQVFAAAAWELAVRRYSSEYSLR